MNDATTATQPSGADLAELMRRHGERVLLRWRQRINDQLPASAAMGESQLIDTLPELYDHLMASAAAPDLALELGRTSVARAHGAERARMSAFSPAELLLELQLLRRCVWEIAHEQDVPLTRDFILAVAGAFDAAERDALTEYDLVRIREHELALREMIARVREHLHVAGTAAQLITRSTNLERIGSLTTRIRRRMLLAEEQLDVDTLKNAALSERLPLLLSTFDLFALAQEVCHDAGPAGCVVSGGAVTGTWCRMSLRQALRNLLAAPGGGVATAIIVQHAHGRVALSVHQTCVLPPDVVANVFSSRNKSTHPTVRDWGTGLAFVRDVAESHGGSAIVQSASGSGTVFTLDIPVDASPFVPSAASR